VIFRQTVFWLHLIAGLVAGSVILVMSVSGIMMAYQPQIIAAAEGGLFQVPKAGERLQPDALLEKLHAAIPDAGPIGLTLRRDADAPASVALGRERTVLLNPYTGALLGEGTWLRPFLHEVEHFHRDLALGERGKKITGACSLAFLALIVTGLYLWFPRKWVKAIALPSLQLRGKARDFTWHNAIGLWAALPLAVIALTGIVMNYSWANSLLFRAAGAEPPPPRKVAAKASEIRSEGVQPPLPLAHLNALWAQAEVHAPDWQTISLRAQNQTAATILVAWGQGMRPDRRATIAANLGTGEVTKLETFANQNSGRRLRMWVRPIHTGEAGGVIGQTVAALASLGAVVLIWTGFALSWRRFSKRSARRTTTIERPLPSIRTGASAGTAESFHAPVMTQV
jgi:uncharacterized iron-regulated membrane protein